MVSQFSKLTVITFAAGAWQDGRSGLVRLVYKEVSNYPSTIKYPQAILLHQLRATPTIIECRQGCAQESTCITGGSYFFLLPHPPPHHNNNIIIIRAQLL